MRSAFRVCGKGPQRFVEQRRDLGITLSGRVRTLCKAQGGQGQEIPAAALACRVDREQERRSGSLEAQRLNLGQRELERDRRVQLEIGRIDTRLHIQGAIEPAGRPLEVVQLQPPARRALRASIAARRGSMRGAASQACRADSASGGPDASPPAASTAQMRACSARRAAPGGTSAS